MKTIGAFVVAAIGGYLIAAVMVSWVNMQSIVDLGFEITVAQRLDTITHDVISLGMTYLPLMTIALLIEFLVAAGIIRLKPSPFIGYIFAGFAAVLALHVIMKAILGLTGIAAVRGPLGLASQGLAGAFAGWIFSESNWAPQSPKGTITANNTEGFDSRLQKKHVSLLSAPNDPVAAPG